MWKCRERAGEWKRLARDIAREDWQELSAGMGSKGPRLFAWARIELAAPEADGWQRWLLVRRTLDEGIKPAEMAYVLIFAPTDTSLKEMVEAFGMRLPGGAVFRGGQRRSGPGCVRSPFLARMVSSRDALHTRLNLFDGPAYERRRRRAKKV